MCGCGGGGRPHALGPEHRWRGGAPALQGAVGPELIQGRGARAQAVLPGIAGQVDQAINGVRSRRSYGDHGVPVAIPSRTSLHDVDIDPPGVELAGRTSAIGLPDGYWQTWDGEQ